MKRIIAIMSAAALLASCADDGICTIRGSVPDYIDGVTLESAEGEVLDSCAVVDGKFTLQCGRTSASAVALVMEAYSEPLVLVPESSSISLKITDTQASIDGSRLSQELAGLQQWTISTYMEYMDKSEKLYEEGDEEGAKAVQDELNELIAKHCRPVFKAHKSDFVGVQALVLMINKIDTGEFLKLYGSAGPAVKEDLRISAYYESLK